MPPEPDGRLQPWPDLFDIRKGPPSRDAGRPVEVASPNFTVRVSLRDTPTTHEDRLHETAGQMADFEPAFHWDSAGRANVTLQVTATDLWVAVLLAMGAITGTGHHPERIEAMPSEPLTANPA